VEPRLRGCGVQSDACPQRSSILLLAPRRPCLHPRSVLVTRSLLLSPLPPRQPPPSSLRTLRRVQVSRRPSRRRRRSANRTWSGVFSPLRMLIRCPTSLPSSTPARSRRSTVARLSVRVTMALGPVYLHLLRLQQRRRYQHGRQHWEEYCQHIAGRRQHRDHTYLSLLPVVRLVEYSPLVIHT
jgi:hypothetical protein